MASAVIASRNESSWGQSFMGKIPYSNTHLNRNPINPNSKPKSSNKKKNPQNHINGRQIVNNPAVVTHAVSDDAYSFNEGTIETNGRAKNGFNLGGYVSYNVGKYSRSELNELRQKLVTELEQIRKLNDRIESGQINPISLSSSHDKFKKMSRNKRPLPFVSSNKDPKKLHPDVPLNNGNVVQNEGLLKMCKQVLTKLMKHKLSWVFNKPVDAAALGLHDYHTIVKRPMDLGTVKSNLGKNLYASPLDFAADVRLTFNNAMLYNPKTDEVHGMADMLLGLFEEMFRPIQAKIGSHCNNDQQHGSFNGVADEVQGSSWDDIRTLERQKKLKSSPPGPPSSKQNHSSSSNPSIQPSSNLPSVESPVPTPSPSPSPVRAQPLKPSMVKPAIGKLPKPRAKDPNKREMSLEEKQKLGLVLQSLPQEKMPQLVQIIRKRNGHLAQEGDEIEVDIEALDTETLWELDRFVTNWKKMVSKTKRQALMINYSSGPTLNIDNIDMDEDQESEKADEGQKKSKKDEEDVDIGNDMPETSFPPVEIEKDDGAQGQSIPQGNGNASSSSSGSSSSSSESSSSSDSDSGSSSGSDSDADEAQS